jgi:hypothetical protein
MTWSKSFPSNHVIWFWNTSFTNQTKSRKTRWIVDLPIANISLQCRYSALWTNLYKKHATQIVTRITHLYIVSFFYTRGFSFAVKLSHELPCNPKVFNASKIIILHHQKMCEPSRWPCFLSISWFLMKHQVINNGHLILMQHKGIHQSLKNLRTCQGIHIDVLKLRFYVINIFITQEQWFI